jgi:hypothetical protein
VKRKQIETVASRRFRGSDARTRPGSSLFGIPGVWLCRGKHNRDYNTRQGVKAVRKNSEQARRPFTTSEIQRVISVADAEWKSLILFGLYTIVRLLAQHELRFKLARFTDKPEELAISYRRESLRDMCREAGIWRSGNKRALSAGTPQLARSVPSTRTGVFSRNAIANQRPAATAHFPLPTFVLNLDGVIVQESFSL